MIRSIFFASELMVLSSLINDCVVDGRLNTVNPERQGTKVAAHYRLTVGAGETTTVRLRLASQSAANKRGKAAAFGQSFDETFTIRRQEADDFYRALTPPSVTPDHSAPDAVHRRRNRRAF